MRADPNPRGGKRVGGEVWFDISLALPFGLRLDESPRGDAVGISEILPGGSADAHNKAHVVTQDTGVPQMWLQPGDKLLAVNGKKCSTKDEAVALIAATKEGQKVSLKLARNRRGPVTVVFPEPARRVTVPPRTKLSDAARAAGHEVEYDCEDGLCGKCWHVNDISGEVYQLCVSSTTACDIPSKGGVRNLDVQLKGLIGALKGEDVPDVFTAIFDNTEPLLLRPCPEIHMRMVDPYPGTWRYVGGEYTISRNEAGTLRYTENGISGDLNEEGDWLMAELPPYGTIRIRPGASTGLSMDMDSSFMAAGSKEWGETKTAFRL